MFGGYEKIAGRHVSTMTQSEGAKESKGLGDESLRRPQHLFRRDERAMGGKRRRIED